MRAEPIADGPWPNREEDAPLAARADRTRWTDATKLTLPLPAVIAIVGTIVGTVLAASLYIVNSVSSVKSDVRVMLVQMEADKEVAKARAEVAAVNTAALKAAIDELRASAKLQQLQYADLKTAVDLLQQGRK